MSLSDRLAAIEGQQVADGRKEKVYPAGWQPGVVWDGANGEITTGPLDSAPSEWDDILLSRGLNPNEFEVVGDTLKWCSYDGWKKDHPDDPAYSAILYSFKAQIRRKFKSGNLIPEDVYQAVRKARPPKKEAPTGEHTFVVALSDWQVGNCDGGGIEAQAQAISDLVDTIPERIKQLRKTGVDIGEVVILGLGDLVEGTCGHYPAQQFRVQLDRRDQTKLVRRGVRDILMSVAPHAQKITVAAVPGNHGENRQNGKSITSVHDNDDVAVFEQVAEILSVNPDAYGHIGFRLSRDEVALSLNLNGIILGLTHGHVTRPSGGALNGVWNWWKDQSMGRGYPGIADADILITGHYHHLNIKEQEGRTLLICPSLTNVGDYFTDSKGVKTRPGTLTLTTHPNGWGNLHLL